MLIAIVLTLLLAVLLFVGLRLTQFAFARRPIPDPLDPDVLKTTDWVQYEPNITNGAKWLQQQTIRELRVLSYDDHMLYGRFIPCENARGTIIQFHGYRSHFAVDFSASMPWYQEQGFNLLLVDHRAHGQSGGKYITFGVKERFDVLSWVTYLTLMLGEDHPIILGGLSMGGTTVCMAADLDFPGNVRGIVADCGFTSPADILGHLCQTRYHVPSWLALPFLSLFARLFAGFGLKQWSTVDALKNAKVPVALFHGTGDNLVPCEMSQKSYEACTSQKILNEFPGAGHGVSWLSDSDRYKTVLADFLEQCLKEDCHGS